MRPKFNIHTVSQHTPFIDHAYFLSSISKHNGSRMKKLSIPKLAPLSANSELNELLFWYTFVKIE